MNFEKPWHPRESELCEMLMDDPLNDPHHFRDFFDEHSIGPETLMPVESDRDADIVFRAVRAAISYVNGELSSNDAIFPPSIIRKGRYPLIRQMRDVHQFDVGSHLAACYLMTRRSAPSAIASRLGLHHLAGSMSATFENAAPGELELAAIFHDFFKAFRSRRPLPSKLGPSQAPSWFLPDGSSPPETSMEDEGEIAAMLLCEFVQDDALVATVSGAIRTSTKFGSAVYRLLNYTDDGAKNVARSVLEPFTEPAAAPGAYIGIIDWLGKGWAMDVLTTRKERKVTLRDAGVLALQTLDELLAEQDAINR